MADDGSAVAGIAAIASGLLIALAPSVVGVYRSVAATGAVTLTDEGMTAVELGGLVAAQNPN